MNKDKPTNLWSFLWWMYILLNSDMFMQKSTVHSVINNKITKEFMLI